MCGDVDALAHNSLLGRTISVWALSRRAETTGNFFLLCDLCCSSKESASLQWTGYTEIVRHLMPALVRRTCMAEQGGSFSENFSLSGDFHLKAKAGCTESEQLLDCPLNRDKRQEGLRYNFLQVWTQLKRRQSRGITKCGASWCWVCLLQN